MTFTTFYQFLTTRRWEKALDLLSKDPYIIDMTYQDGKTILMKSLNEETIFMTKFLLLNGADVNIQDKEGFTVLMLLLSEFHSYPRNLFKEYLFTIISHSNIDFNIENNYGYNVRELISLDKDLEDFIYENYLYLSVRDKYNFI